MTIRPFQQDDAEDLAALSATCARGETDFVLNPMWETPDELFAEFRRLDIAPDEHVLVEDDGGGHVLGLAGFLRRPKANTAGMLCPIVARGERGRGMGGELLRAALARARGELEIEFVSAAIGVRNRAGYALLGSQGFRPARQYFLMRCNDAPPPRRMPVEGLVLEDAEAADAEAILALYASCGFEKRSLEEMQHVLGDGIHAHAVARHDGRVVAFAEIETHWPRRVWVAYVGVLPELRDRGLGSGLVGWALARRFEAGAQAGLLMLSPANRTALRAYEKVGFRMHRVVDVLEKAL